MNKLIVAAEVAVVLIIAVICTAGCFEIHDPVEGTYAAAGGNTSETYVVFEANGSGYFIAAAETDDSAAAAGVSFDWTAVEPKKTYELVLADGTTKTASLNVERGVLTIDGVEYQETLDKFSGAITQKAITTQKEHDQPIKGDRDDEGYEGKYAWR